MIKKETEFFAIRLEVLPGKSLLEKFSNAAKYGFTAVELPGRHLVDYYYELVACKEKLPLPVCSISLGFEGSLLSTDEKIREKCRDDIKRLLDLCAKLGAVGLVMPPVLFMDKCERFSGRDGDTVILEQLPMLAEYARKRAVHLMLEPVNREETDYLTKLEHAVQLCEQVNNPGLAITADLFHMNKEEMDMTTALRRCGKWLKLFHISEIPDRTEPAPGGLNFKAAFKVLREIGYKGYTVSGMQRTLGTAK